MAKAAAAISQDMIANFVLENDVSESDLEGLQEFIRSGDLEKFGNYTHKPVGLKEFITSPEYLKADEVLWPKVLKALKELNSGDYVEAVLTGAIGTAKTTIALYTTAYQLYLLSCMKSPHKKFGLDPASEILFIFQSITKDLAKGVDYNRFKSMIESSPYFTRHFPFDKSILSELRFPNRIIVKPVAGSETAALGQNVIGGVIDELNFMAVVEKSKAAVDGGTYDQAVALYNSISRRRKTRFMKKGVLPGVLCLVSSKRYPGQFTDTKIEEAKKELVRTGKTTIFVYDKKTWEVMPEDTFTGKWFKIFLGDLSRKPRIIAHKRELKGLEPDLVIPIPLEYKSEFETDMMNAMRDIAGESTLATIPFITNLDKLAEAFDHKLPSLFSEELCDFQYKKVGILKKVVNASEMQYPRFAHVDLGLTSDHAGIAIGHVNKFVPIDLDGNKVMMPNIIMDGMLRIAPPPNSEINFEKIRKLFYMLANMEYPLRWITFDSYQSVDSIQLLRGKGFSTGNQSMDMTTVPYDTTKTAILQNRLHMRSDTWVQTEFARLERVVVNSKSKIDHPTNGTKDVADAVAGVVYGLTMQNFIWVSFGIMPNPAITVGMYNLEEKSAAKTVNY